LTNKEITISASTVTADNGEDKEGDNSDCENGSGKGGINNEDT